MTEDHTCHTMKSVLLGQGSSSYFCLAVSSRPSLIRNDAVLLVAFLGWPIRHQIPL